MHTQFPFASASAQIEAFTATLKKQFFGQMPRKCTPIFPVLPALVPVQPGATRPTSPDTKRPSKVAIMEHPISTLSTPNVPRLGLNSRLFPLPATDGAAKSPARASVQLAAAVYSASPPFKAPPVRSSRDIIGFAVKTSSRHGTSASRRSTSRNGRRHR